MGAGKFTVLGPIQRFLALQPGATVSDVAAALQMPWQQAAQTLYRAALRGHVHVLKGERYTYYLTEAERDEAARIGVTVAPKACNTESNTASIIEAVRAHDGRLGATHPHLLRVTGLTARQVTKVLSRMVYAGRLFSACCKGVRHYFLSAEARDAGAKEFVAAEQRAAAEKRAARQKAAVRPLKFGVNAPVQLSSAPRKAWDKAPAVVPGDVKVTVCPTYQDTRYTVDPASVPRIPVQMWGQL